jgi:hypothetical protein
MADVTSSANQYLANIAASVAGATPAGTNAIGKVDPIVATPTIYNVTLTSADTEYSQALPANCRAFELQCRSSNAIRVAFVTGKVATPTAPYISIKADGSYASRDLSQGASPSTVYLACAAAGVVVEIVAWV